LANAAAGSLVYAAAAGFTTAEFAWTGIPLPGGKAAQRERAEAEQLQLQGSCGLPTKFNGGDMRPFDEFALGPDYFQGNLR
jgi:hypothetical protein